MAAVTDKAPEDQAGQLIQNAKCSRARIFDTPGSNLNNFLAEEIGCSNKCNVADIDQDYQMIDAHVDDALRKKILSFEYIAFCKLLVKNRGFRDEENQRLEIVNKNGLSYLAPASNRDILQISGYSHWEQAFRVYSNMITGWYPSKASELLQYSHTIHMASASYV